MPYFAFPLSWAIGPNQIISDSGPFPSLKLKRDWWCTAESSVKQPDSPKPRLHRVFSKLVLYSDSIAGVIRVRYGRKTPKSTDFKIVQLIRTSLLNQRGSPNSPKCFESDMLLIRFGKGDPVDVSIWENVSKLRFDGGFLFGKVFGAKCSAEVLNES